MCHILFVISACNKGFYGGDCNEKCGQCREVEKCHHINGTCLTGCAAGFMGTLCTTGIQTCTLIISEIFNI